MIEKMNIKDLNIRDPYILSYDGMYYMYGTRSETCWGPAWGFDVYESKDLEEWDGPFEIFKREEGFFADHSFWAPECIAYNGGFYLITTFGFDVNKKGIFILKSDNPKGPFEMYSNQLTPKDWVCIDGSLFFDDEKPLLYFSHSFEDSPEGDMCVVELSPDLKSAVSDAKKIFSAKEAPWARPVPFAKEEFGMDGDVYFTDGPCVFRGDGERLFMTWSSWSEKGYAVGAAVSENGNPYGPWLQQEKPLFPENGGHGMVFKTFEGERKFLLHYPNDKYMERPVIYPLFSGPEF